MLFKAGGTPKSFMHVLLYVFVATRVRVVEWSTTPRRRMSSFSSPRKQQDMPEACPYSNGVGTRLRRVLMAAGRESGATGLVILSEAKNPESSDQGCHGLREASSAVTRAVGNEGVLARNVGA